MPPIFVNDFSFDPAEVQKDVSASNYILLQTGAGLTDAQGSELAKLTVNILSLFAFDKQTGSTTYLCRHESRNQLDFKPIRNLQYVQSVTDYPRSAVLDSSLLPENLQVDWPFVYERIKGSPKAGLFVLAEIILQQDTPMTGDSLFAKLRTQVDATSLQKVSACSAFLRVRIASEYLSTAANLEDVASIVPYLANEGPLTVRARRQVGFPVLSGTNKPLLVANETLYQGEGQIVGMVERGFDNGLIDSVNIHPAFCLQEEKNGTVVRTPLIVTRDGSQKVEADSDLCHGVGIAACITGTYPPVREKPSMDEEPDTNRCQGMAPKAKVLFQLQPVKTTEELAKAKPVADDQATIARHVEDLVACGGSIQNNSWGGEDTSPAKVPEGKSLIACIRLTQVTYRGNDTMVDKLTFENPSLLLLFANGNTGYALHRRPDQYWKAGDVNGFSRQVVSPALAKNALSVGACLNHRLFARRGKEARGLEPWSDNCVEGRFGYPPASEDMQEAWDFGIAHLSAKGPTVAGILKPDLVAPGAGMLTAHGQNRQAEKSDVPGLERNYCDNPLLAYHEGTSLATPIVSGIAAALKQAAAAHDFAITGPGLRAILVNGAVSMQGLSFWLTNLPGKSDYSPATSGSLSRISATANKVTQSSTNNNTKSVVNSSGDKANVASSSAGKAPAQPEDTNIDPRTWVRMMLGPPPDCIQGFGQVHFARSLKHIFGSLVQPSIDLDANTSASNKLQASSGPSGPNGLVQASFPAKKRSEGTFKHRFMVDDSATEVQVTLAYNDGFGKSSGDIQYDVSITMKVYVLESGNGTKERLIATAKPREVQRYGYDKQDQERNSNKLSEPHLGTVRKIYWSLLDVKDGVRAKDRIVAEISVVRPGLFWISEELHFAVAWLSETPAQVRTFEESIRTLPENDIEYARKRGALRNTASSLAAPDSKQTLLNKTTPSKTVVPALEQV